MKGLNDIPICYVEDHMHQRFLLSAPSGQDLGPGYRPPGSTRYSARGKLQSAVGIGKFLMTIIFMALAFVIVHQLMCVVPVTYAWRDELEKKTQNALHRALGNIPPASRGGIMSRSSQRGPSQFDGLEDGKVSIHTSYTEL